MTKKGKKITIIIASVIAAIAGVIAAITVPFAIKSKKEYLEH